MKVIIVFFLFVVSSFIVNAQTENSYAKKMAATVMTIWKDSITNGNSRPARWSYDQGVILKGIEGLWKFTGDGKYFNYMQKSMDHFVDSEGNIRTYKLDDYTLDNILCGRILLLLYKVTGKEKYYKAAATLRKQLAQQPRTNEGGFWHKKIYPDQMWLDGLYMAEPFYAEWAATLHEDSDFNDIARQFIVMEKHARDPKTGLLYHGYDESKKEAWANKTTGLSANFWARAMGWYGMALVDALPYFPKDHPQRKELIEILKRFAVAVSKVQDSKTGLWWDVLNYPNRKGNYLEASASCMFVYTLLKGVRLGYLSSSYLPIAKKGYAGIIKRFITNVNGQTSLKGTVSVSGLGGHPYRDGSYEYYVNEKVVTNDPKGIGAFILASDEMDLLPTLNIGKGKTVLLDSYFNNEFIKNAAGQLQSFHYKWEEEDNGGFSLFGYLFRSYGVHTKTLYNAPTLSNLKGADIYIIVDPDTKKETAHPNYIEPNDVDVIYNWVKNGGVLVMMANDSANVELPHFNTLAQRFGIHWSDTSRNMVVGRKFEMGAIHISPHNPIFPSVKKVYLKEICLLKLSPPAKAGVTEDGDVIMAVSKVGKGTVFAVGDPWFYNEYLDGRKLPAEYQNFEAAKDLIKWLIKQTAK
ncbi:MAG TPA: glycoside hydrolase family 88 protein [Hanamia sp.]|nr:glycoside hydrolase family 88 protein [Hanamia sp.]